MHLLSLFGFFSLVLVAVYWVNRAVGLFDQLIGDGQSALVFVEFSLLALPNVIRLVLPVSAFAACVYAVNRLMQDSELVVMQATGFSTFRLARPVVWFGVIVILMQLALTNVLVPESQRRLATRTAEVSDNITSRFLTEGRFMHPSDNVTLYIRQISEHGELKDLFLSDERTPGEAVTYTARQALLVRAEEGPRLVMMDGMIQRMTRGAAQPALSLTRFGDFTLELAGIVKRSEARGPSLREYATPALFSLSEAQLQAARSTRANALEEAHSRLAGPLLGLAAPLLGFAALMLGGWSRFGMWRQIAVAVGLIIILQMINTAASSQAMRHDNGWPLVYVAPLLGTLVAIVLMWWSQRPRRRPTQPSSPEPEAAA